jgi:hypothetical protein
MQGDLESKEAILGREVLEEEHVHDTSSIYICI